MQNKRMWILYLLIATGILLTGCVYWYIAPSEPLALFPANNSTGVETAVTLRWTRSEGSTPIAYDVYFDTDPNPTTLLTPEVGIEATAVNSPALQENTVYYWKVVARNRGGRTESNTWKFTTLFTSVPPSAPIPYSPANGAAQLSVPVTLYWNASATGTSPIFYDVYLDTNPNPVTKIVDGTSALTTVCSALQTNTTYYWKVVARNSQGSAQSTIWSFSTYNPGTGPSTPVNVTPTAGATQVSLNPVLTWHTSSGTPPIYYDVFLDTNAVPTTKIANGLTQTTYAPGPLSPSTVYYWRVEAYNAYGGPVGGLTTSFTTQASETDPSSPINLYPAHNAEGIPLQLYLVWQHSSGTQPITYDVYFGTTPTPTEVIGQNVTQNFLSTPALTANTTYYWYVVSTNALGSSTGTTTAFTTAGGSGLPPTNLTLLSPANGQSAVPLSTTLMWSCQGTLPITYHVWVGETPALSGSTDYKGATTTPSYALSGLTQGRTYYWKVSATNAYGAGVTSSVYSFTTATSVPVGPIYLEKLPSGNGFQVKSMSYFTPVTPFVMVLDSSTINFSNMAMLPDIARKETFGNFSVILSTDANEIATSLSGFSPSNLTLFTIITTATGSIQLNDFVSGVDVPIDPSRKSVTLP